MNLVFYGIVTDLKKSFVAVKLRHRKNTKVAKSLNLVPANNSNNKVAVAEINCPG